MSKISPGGWHRGTGNGEGSIFADEGRMRLEEKGTTLYPICRMVKGWDPEEDEANEIAVAALPELLKDYHELKQAHRDLLDRAHVAGLWGPWSDGWEGSYDQRHWGEE